jgi:hypothetical protein
LGREAKLTNKKTYQGTYREQYTKDYRRVKEGLFEPAAGVETRAKVIAPERTAERGARALQKHAPDNEYRQDYLHVGQYLLEKNHREERTIPDYCMQIVGGGAKIRAAAKPQSI